MLFAKDSPLAGPVLSRMMGKPVKINESGREEDADFVIMDRPPIFPEFLRHGVPSRSKRTHARPGEGKPNRKERGPDSNMMKLLPEMEERKSRGETYQQIADWLSTQGEEASKDSVRVFMSRHGKKRPKRTH